MSQLPYKLLGSAGAVVAGIAARKAVTTGWKLATGTEPPANPEDPDTSWQEALGWAIVSGVVVGIARLLVARKATAYYRRSTGHLPEDMQEVAA